MYSPLFIVLITCVISILGNSSRNSKCSKTICPAVKATICVKVEPKNDTQTGVRYVMMSKCKLKQIKCFNDVKTTVVPVKLCSATSLRDGTEPDEGDRERVQNIVNKLDKKMNEIKDQSEKKMDEYKDLANKFGPLKGENQEDKAALSEDEAPKDDAKEESVILNSESDYNNTGPYEEMTQTPNDPQSKERESTNTGEDQTETNPVSDNPANGNEAHGGEDAETSVVTEDSYTTEPFDETTPTTNDSQSKEGESTNTGEDQTETNLVSDNPASGTEAHGGEDAETSVVTEDTYTTEPFDETTPTTNDPQYNEKESSETGAMPAEIHEDLDNSDAKASEPLADDKNDSKNKKLDNTESADNEGECPQKCPTGDVMVCARCSHRIYRTFMSLCYMRMYQCHNPNEKLELVSRHACQGSAPYLGEMARPKNNLVLSQDDDPVLNYIFAAKDSGHPKLNVR